MATLRYAAINLAYWAGFCLLMGFSSVFLLSRGLSNTQIGLVVAFSGIASAVGQPIVADLAARSRRPLRLWIAGLAAAVAAVAGALMLPASLVAVAIVYGIALAVLQLGLPLVNALGMQAAHDGVPVDFGPARAVGSLSFGLTSLGVGALITVTSAEVIPVVVIASQALLAIAVLTFVFAPRGAQTVVEADDAPDVAPLSAAARRRFLVLLIGITGCYASHGVINTYVFQIVDHHGGTEADLGIAIFIGAAAEVLPLIFFRRIVARWHPSTLLRVAAVVYAIRALTTLFAPSLTVFYLAQSLQIASFALITPATVYWVDRMLPLADRLRGQAFMTLTLTLGNVLAGLGGGLLLDWRGVPALLAAGAAAAVLAVGGVLAGTTGERSPQLVA